MDRHPYFTEIPMRSFEATAFEGRLSEALLALIVEPLEAEDVARSIREIYDGRIELASDSGVIDAPIGVDDFADLGLKAFESMKITVSQWVMTTERADVALDVLAKWDQRFVVWCASAAAREGLRFVPEGERRPLRAIETAEAWVTGKATMDDVRAAAAAVDTAVGNYARTYAVRYGTTYGASLAAAAASLATAAAANAAYYISAAANAAANTAYAAYVANTASGGTTEADELSRLREVVANACLTFPG